MITCTIEDEKYLVFKKNGVEIYDINMDTIWTKEALDLKIKAMESKNWMSPAMLERIEKTIHRYFCKEAVA